MKTKVIAIVNQKGGVGKTTTTVNLGVGLAMEGKKVLLIDADHQGALTDSLGYKNADELDISIATMMDNIIFDNGMSAKEGILHHEEGVDLMPANMDLSEMELKLVGLMNREKILKEYINTVKHDYDYVLIDSNPSLGMVTVNVLAAADSVIIPVQAQYLPAKGMTQLIRSINSVKRYINPGLKVEGILMTLIDQRTNLSKEVIHEIRANYGKQIHVFEAEIPIGTTAAEAAAAGKSIFSHDGKGTVAKAYSLFTKEVLKNGEREKIQHRSAECR